jgi:hypothetical protein
MWECRKPAAQMQAAVAQASFLLASNLTTKHASGIVSASSCVEYSNSSSSSDGSISFCAARPGF